MVLKIWGNPFHPSFLYLFQWPMLKMFSNYISIFRRLSSWRHPRYLSWASSPGRWSSSHIPSFCGQQEWAVGAKTKALLSTIHIYTWACGLAGIDSYTSSTKLRSCVQKVDFQCYSDPDRTWHPTGADFGLIFLDSTSHVWIRPQTGLPLAITVCMDITPRTPCL